MSNVIVVGSINQDMVVFAERLPVPGETVLGRDLRRFPGSKGANQALAAGRLGAPVRLVGRVGADPAGRDLIEFLAAEGIDVSGIRALPQSPTGTALIVVAAGGENTIVLVPGANDRLRPEDLANVPLAPGDLAVAQLEIPVATVAAFLDRAASVGALTLFNPAPARPDCGDLIAR